MNEELDDKEWYACKDLGSMCEMLGRLEAHDVIRISDRKLRLFLVACLRPRLDMYHYYGLLELASWRVDLIERCAEGLISWMDLDRFLHQDFARKPGMDRYRVTPADYQRLGIPPRPEQRMDAPGANDCARDLSVDDAMTLAAQDGIDDLRSVSEAAVRLCHGVAVPEHERRLQLELFRDIFGTPFRSTTIAPSWLTHAVVGLAREIYQERMFERMPELGSALQDAGCQCQNLIAHCHTSEPHVRGCWVLDLLLDKK